MKMLFIFNIVVITSLFLIFITVKYDKHVDLTNAVFLFFASIFSLSLTRNINEEENHEEMKLGKFNRSIRTNDFLILAFFNYLCSDRFFAFSI